MSDRQTQQQLFLLYQQLTQTQSKWQRLRIIAAAWKLLQAVPPEHRNRLLLSAGVDGAEGFLSHLAEQHGEGPLPPEVHTLLQMLEQTDPEEAKAFMTAIRDPEQRDRLMKAALQQASHVAQTIAVPPPVPSPPPTEFDEAEDTPVPAQKPVAPVEVAAPPPPPPVVAPKPAPKTPPKTLQKPVQKPTQKPEPTPPTPPSEERSSLKDTKRDEGSSPIEKLQKLRANSNALETFSLEQLQALLQTFSSGWSRGRALRSMLEKGIPKDFTAALHLIEHLENPAAERFCYGTLAQRSALTEEEKQKLLQHAPWLKLRMHSTH